MTHLIAGQVGSDKYHVARKLCLPVLLPSWVESSWEAGLGLSSAAAMRSATDPAVLSQHCCPPFTGCVVTVTGLDEGVRQRVKETCQAKGGKYSGELTKGVCTHLLVGSKSSELLEYSELPLIWTPEMRPPLHFKMSQSMLPSANLPLK